MLSIKRIIPLILVLSLGLVGCSNLNESSNSESSSPISEDLKSSVVSNYATIVYESYLDSLNQAKAMQTEILSFLDAPSAEGLVAAQTAWKQARIPYGQTEGYRFYEGPIDDEDGPEGQLNAWPLDEFYIDYHADYPNGGIINGTDTITKELIIGKNEQGGDANISTGYHAIEFLLWGQDTSIGAGAGERPYTDYVTDGTGTASNQDRRQTYLKLVTEILITDLQSLVDEWDPTKSNLYRDTFLALESDVAIGKMLRGIGALAEGELFAERLGAPLDDALLDADRRENEHSCFSDNTKSDVVQNAQSVQNVYLGTFTKADGSVVGNAAYSLYELGKKANSSLAEALKTSLETTKDLADKIQDPFDQEILSTNTEGRARVSAVGTALEAEAKLIVDLGTALNISVNTSID